MLGREPHMYSGLAHYSAELVPAVMAAAILGTEWLAYRCAPRWRIPPRLTVTAASLYLLAMSVANTHANGFGPFTAGFDYPPVTTHEQIGQRLLARVPPTASVSASDMLDPHLSDRPYIYLFPYYQHVPSPHGAHGHPTDYVILDTSTSIFPLQTSQEVVQRIENMLHDRNNPYSIVAAEDGYVLLKRGRQGGHTLPASFYTFMLPAHPTIGHPLQVDYGDSLQMIGYDIERREQVNLRAPDVILTTYWRVTRPLAQRLSFGFFLTNADGAIDWSQANQQMDQMALDWRPTNTWKPGQIVRVSTTQMGVYTTTPGAIDVDVMVIRQGGSWAAADQRIAPIVRAAPRPLEVVDRGTILKLTSLPVPF
jgi:hypothetical protein